MGYVGTTAIIPLGSLGLQTDDPQSSTPPNAAIKTSNVVLYKGGVDKSPGSTRYSNVALTSSVVGVYDYWPTASQQRLMAATSDGKIWKDNGDQTWNTSTPVNFPETQRISFDNTPTAGNWVITFAATNTGTLAYNISAANLQIQIRTLPGLSSALVTGDFTPGLPNGFLVKMVGTSGDQAALAISNSLTWNGGATSVVVTVTEVNKGKVSLGAITPDMVFVSGGAEASLRNKKLFIFSGTQQVQVLNGDDSNGYAISRPSADWTSAYPTFGIIYQGRLCAFGNSNSPHTLYISGLGDQENFDTSTGTTLADPGLYQVFSGEADGLIGALVYKGLLFLFKRPFGVYICNWQDTSQPPIITRFSDAFGIAGPHAATQVLDDLIAGNNSGSLSSLKATNAFGGLEAGDVLAITKTRNNIRENTDPSGYAFQHAIYYPEKQMAYYSARSTSGVNHQDRMIVLDVKTSTPRVLFETKDNPVSLGLRRDSNKVLRPMYGDPSGYVYLMDQNSRSVNGAPYVGEFQTPYIDFSYLDQSLASKSKLFDFLEVTYATTGNWNFYVDVYTEGIYVETVTFIQKQGAALDSFVLDRDRLGGVTTQQLRNPLHTTGKTISLRIYNGNANEYFSVERMSVGFRVSAEQNFSSKG